MRIEPEEATKLVELEKNLHRRDVRGSRETVDRLLADDFTEIGRSGRIYDKAQILAALAAETGLLSVEADDFACRKIADGIVLLTYATRAADEAGTRSTLRSSLWKKVAGNWRMQFHQGTPTDVPRIETV